MKCITPPMTASTLLPNAATMVPVPKNFFTFYLGKKNLLIFISISNIIFNILNIFKLFYMFFTSKQKKFSNLIFFSQNIFYNFIFIF